MTKDVSKPYGNPSGEANANLHVGRWVWWWCAIFFGVQLIMFFFGFEETKFTHFETLEGRQGSVVSASYPGAENFPSGGEKPHPEADVPSKGANVQDGSDEDLSRTRKLSVVHINTSIPRKT